MSIRPKRIGMTNVGWISAGLAALLLPLSSPADVGAQGTSSGGGDFGRISSGGGSYGSLTLGVTADGIANTLRPSRKRPARRPHRDRPHIRPPFGTLPLAAYVYPVRGRAMAYPGGAPEPTEGTEERLRTPSADRLPEPPPSAEERGAPSDAAAAEGGGDRRVESSIRVAPRVTPPTPPDSSTAERTLAPDLCAKVRITTAGGIEWRQRVSIQDFDAETPGEVAARLQRTLDRGDPISMSGPDGSFTVRARMVRGLVVGPCRGH